MDSKECKKCGLLFIPRTSRNAICPKCSRGKRSNKQLERIKRQSKLNNSKKPIIRHLNYGYGCQCAICGWSALKDIYGFTTEINKRVSECTMRNNPNGTLTTGLDIHHIVKVSNGGNDTYDNLIPLCPNCHRLAHMNLFEESFWKQVLLDEKTIVSNYSKVKEYIDSQEYIKSLVDIKPRRNIFFKEMSKYATASANRSNVWR